MLVTPAPKKLKSTKLRGWFTGFVTIPFVENLSRSVRQIDRPWKRFMIQRCKNVSRQTIRNRAVSEIRKFVPETSVHLERRRFRFPFSRERNFRGLVFQSTCSVPERERERERIDSRRGDTFTIMTCSISRETGPKTVGVFATRERQYSILIGRPVTYFTIKLFDSRVAPTVICAGVIYASVGCVFPRENNRTRNSRCDF